MRERGLCCPSHDSTGCTRRGPARAAADLGSKAKGTCFLSYSLYTHVYIGDIPMYNHRARCGCCQPALVAGCVKQNRSLRFSRQTWSSPPGVLSTQGDTMSREKPSIRNYSLPAMVFCRSAPSQCRLSSLAKSYDDEETTPLLKAPEHSKVSMAEGVQQLSPRFRSRYFTKYDSTITKTLPFYIYGKKRALARNPEHNVLKEFSAVPENPRGARSGSIQGLFPHVAPLRTIDVDGMAKTFLG